MMAIVFLLCFLSHLLNNVVIELSFHGEICSMIKMAHHTLNDDAHQTTYLYQEFILRYNKYTFCLMVKLFTFFSSLIELYTILYMNNQ